MDTSKRDYLRLISGAMVFAAAGRLASRPSFAAGGNGNSNGNGNGGGGGGGSGNGKGNGNGGGNGNAGGGGNAGGNAGGNGNGNGAGSGSGKGNGSGKSDGGNGSSATSSVGTQARESADGSIDIRYPNGMTEMLRNGRYTMKDSKGRTIISRLATSADARRLNLLLR